MFKRGQSEIACSLSTVFVAMVMVLGLFGTAPAVFAQDSVQGLDTARCERTSDLKHWRCEVSCAAGESGIATCPTQSAWGACGRQVLHQACGISEVTPAVACVRKVVLAGPSLDQLKSTCDRSYTGVDEILEGPLQGFPGLAYRPAE